MLNLEANLVPRILACSLTFASLWTIVDLGSCRAARASTLQLLVEAHHQNGSQAHALPATVTKPTILKQYILYLIAYLSGVYRMHLSLVGQSFAHPPVKEETVEWQVGHAEKSCVRDALRCDADMFS